MTESKIDPEEFDSMAEIKEKLAAIESKQDEIIGRLMCLQSSITALPRFRERPRKV